MPAQDPTPSLKTQRAGNKSPGGPTRGHGPRLRRGAGGRDAGAPGRAWTPRRTQRLRPRQVGACDSKLRFLGSASGHGQSGLCGEPGAWETPVRFRAERSQLQLCRGPWFASRATGVGGGRSGFARRCRAGGARCAHIPGGAWSWEPALPPPRRRRCHSVSLAGPLLCSPPPRLETRLALRGLQKASGCPAPWTAAPAALLESGARRGPCRLRQDARGIGAVSQSRALKGPPKPSRSKPRSQGHPRRRPMQGPVEARRLPEDWTGTGALGSGSCALPG